MEISNGVHIIGLSLYLEDSKTLIISDLQIGIEESLTKQGILIPKFQFKDMIKQLEDIFKKVKPNTIVLAGDVKHEFGTISDEEWRNVLKLIDFLKNNSKKLVLVKGNHDTILAPIAEKRDIEIVDTHIVDGKLICHGHQVPDVPSGVDTIVIGHEHPALGISDDVRSEKYKCFLRGKWNRYTLIVLPSFSPFTEGTDVLGGGFLSPFLDEGVGEFEAWAVADKVYHFGKLKKLMK